MHKLMNKYKDKLIEPPTISKADTRLIQNKTKQNNNFDIRPSVHNRWHDKQPIRWCCVDENRTSQIKLKQIMQMDWMDIHYKPNSITVQDNMQFRSNRLPLRTSRKC